MSLRASSGDAVAASAERFDRHTAVDRHGPRRWRADIDDRLTGFGGIHGGYLAAIALRAMMRIAGDETRRPRSLRLNLFAPTKPAPLDLRPQIDHSGSSTVAVSVALEQETRTTGRASALFGRPGPAVEYLGDAMPQVPPPEDCPALRGPVPEVPVGRLVEHRRQLHRCRSPAPPGPS